MTSLFCNLTHNDQGFSHRYARVEHSGPTICIKRSVSPAFTRARTTSYPLGSHSSLRKMAELSITMLAEGFAITGESTELAKDRLTASCNIANGEVAAVVAGKLLGTDPMAAPSGRMHSLGMLVVWDMEGPATQSNGLATNTPTISCTFSESLLTDYQRVLLAALYRASTSRACTDFTGTRKKLLPLIGRPMWPLLGDSFIDRMLALGIALDDADFIRPATVPSLFVGI